MMNLIQAHVTKELHFVISSHINFAPICLPRLLESLHTSGVPHANIRVVVGGSESESEEALKGIFYHYVTHNSFDFTGLIDVLDTNTKAERWFLLHDTCEAGPLFYAKASAYDRQKPLCMASPHGWTNMGAFSWDFLEEARSFIMAMRNCSKERAMLSEGIFMRMGDAGKYAEYDYTVTKNIDVYQQGTMRQRCYFSSIDLIKYMANHAQAHKRVLKP